MARFSNVNTTPATGAVAMYDLKTVLKAAGWTVTKSSDGTTYNSSGDQITGGGAGANGMANNGAWFVVKEPTSDGREWCFQRSTAGTNVAWRIKMSSVDGFVGGSPGATRVPSAADEQVLIGGGTDAAPSFGSYFTTDATYRAHHIAQSDAVGGVYGWWSFTTINATGAGSSFMCQEPLDTSSYPALTGTRASPVSGESDAAIYVVSQNPGTTNFTTSSTWAALQVGSILKGWYKMNYAGETFVGGYTTLTQNTQSQTIVNGLAADPFTNTERLIPLIFYRTNATTQIGLKGKSKYLRFRTLNRAYPDTYNLASDARTIVGDIVIPWPNGVTPLL